MKLDFTKMNGAGNDFIMIDHRDCSLAFSSKQIEKLCDRHRGIGADGLLAVESGETTAYRMRYYNADGHEAEMCGNGARCFTRYVARLSEQKSGSVSFQTEAGVLSGELLGDQVKLMMSDPHSIQLGQSIQLSGQQYEVHSINTGVPHAVIFVENLELARIFHTTSSRSAAKPDEDKADDKVGRNGCMPHPVQVTRRGQRSIHQDVRKLQQMEYEICGLTPVVQVGRELRHHPRFAPAGTNVNFVQILTPTSLAIRTYERGVEDETLACGTGIVAAALLHHLTSKVSGPISVLARGGDRLEVNFDLSSLKKVTLTGPADFVFEGSIELPKI